ncbi:hypothetical protein COU54_03995 [Candidatus Pacearchaeota archaeon CG10_big_fil_rev_8_21_14_0_10_31_24]|nr:MAG: hypothetical protein COU54_03995 [Candidatus Pacearchaeota archaeon CG10_big_fil_rev_8_21_14_0_10_31_24]
MNLLEKIDSWLFGSPAVINERETEKPVEQKKLEPLSKSYFENYASTKTYKSGCGCFRGSARNAYCEARNSLNFDLEVVRLYSALDSTLHSYCNSTMTSYTYSNLKVVEDALKACDSVVRTGTNSERLEALKVEGKAISDYGYDGESREITESFVEKYIRRSSLFSREDNHLNVLRSIVSAQIALGRISSQYKSSENILRPEINRIIDYSWNKIFKDIVYEKSTLESKAEKLEEFTLEFPFPGENNDRIRRWIKRHKKKSPLVEQVVQDINKARDIFQRCIDSSESLRDCELNKVEKYFKWNIQQTACEKIDNAKEHSERFPSRGNNEEVYRLEKEYSALLLEKETKRAKIETETAKKTKELNLQRNDYWNKVAPLITKMKERKMTREEWKEMMHTRRETKRKLST